MAVARRAEYLMGNGQHSVESFQHILADHERYEPPDGNICRHGPEKETKFSVVFEPQRGIAWYAPGNPCIRPYTSLMYW